MDIFIIGDEQQAEAEGIFEKLNSFFGPNVEKCFRNWINSPEYYKGTFLLTFDGDINNLEISSLEPEYMTEYAKVFSETRGLDAITFNSAHLLGGAAAFSSRFLEANLARIVTTKNNVVFLGKGNKFLAAINRGEDIDYDYFENLKESENYRLNPFHLETTSVDNVEKVPEGDNIVSYTLNFLVRADFNNETVNVPLKLDAIGKLEDDCITLLRFKNVRFDSDISDKLDKILSDYDYRDVDNFFKDVNSLILDEDYIISYLDN